MPFLRLIRPINGLIASLVVVVSSKITGGENSGLSYLILGAFFISSFLNATNDINDIEEDRINHPDRPLITGELTLLDAFMISIICLFLGLYLSSKHSHWALMIGSLGMFVGLMYNYELKSLPIIGNLAVAFVIFLAFLYGANPNNPYRVLPAAILGAYMHLIREIVKSLEDRKGDILNRKTVAHIVNERFLQHVIFFGILVLTVVDVLPVMFGYSMYYGITVILFVNAPLLIFAWTVYIGKYSLLKKVIKLSTVLAIIPLWVA